MKREEIQAAIDRVLPNLYRYAMAVSPDALLAQQSIVDALTVYLIENKDFLLSEDIDLNDREERISFLKYLTSQMIYEVFQLLNKKTYLYKGIQAGMTPEYREFNSLSISERTILYLKEVEGYSIPKIQGLLSLKYHELIQQYYNSKNVLLRDINQGQELDNFMEQVSNSRNFHLINSLVYETCGASHKDRVEQLLVSDKDLREYYNIKLSEREFLKQLIPDIPLKKLNLSPLRREVISVISEIFPELKPGLFGKVKKALNKPIFRIEI